MSQPPHPGCLACCLSPSCFTSSAVHLSCTKYFSKWVLDPYICLAVAQDSSHFSPVPLSTSNNLCSWALFYLHLVSHYLYLVPIFVSLRKYLPPFFFFLWLVSLQTALGRIPVLALAGPQRNGMGLKCGHLFNNLGPVVGSDTQSKWLNKWITNGWMNRQMTI